MISRGKRQRPIPEALLLDLDGVLVDTVPLNIEAHRRAALAHGLHLTERELEAQRGMLPKEFYEMVLQVRGRPIDEAERLAEFKEWEVAQIALAQPAQACAGAKELIDSAHSRGVRIAVVTAAQREKVERRLHESGLWDTRLVLVSGDDIARGKPAADSYAEAVRRIQADAERCIAVEDAESGVRSARAAGVYCIGLDDPQNVRLQEADEVACDLWEVANLLGWRKTARS